MKLSIIVLVSLALAGCASESSKKTANLNDDSNSSMSASGESQSTPSVASWDGVVQSIDRADNMATGGAVGAAAAGSSTGYRVTVKKPDGTTEMINVDDMPTYRVGDNVRYANGRLSASPKY